MSSTFDAVGLRVTATSLRSLRDGVLPYAFSRDFRALDVDRLWSQDQEGERLAQTIEAALAAHGVSRHALEVVGHIGTLSTAGAGGLINDGGMTALYAVRYIQKKLLDWDDIVRFDCCWAPAFLTWQARQFLAAYAGTRAPTVLLGGIELLPLHLEREEAKRRVRAAFEAMETLVATEGLASYGVAYADHPTTPGFDLRELDALAREVTGGAHHLRHARVHVRPYDVLQSLEALGQAPGSDLAVSLSFAGRSEPSLFASTDEGVDRGCLEQGLLGEVARLVLCARSLPSVATVFFEPTTLAHVAQAAQARASSALPATLGTKFFAVDRSA